MKYRLILTACLAALLLLPSCKDYGDDLTKVGERVVVLEHTDLSVLESKVAQLQQLVELVEGRDYITSVVDNGDGSYTLHLKSGGTYILKEGAAGTNGTAINLGIAKSDTDGLYYWTVDGQWLMVGGSMVRASGIKGEAGDNAVTSFPRVRINPTTRTWEVYDETAGTYVNTGISADGKPGTPDYIEKIQQDPATGTVTIWTRDGQVIQLQYRL